MENREFYIPDDGIRLHAKLDFPAEEKEKYPLVILFHGFTGHMEERHIVGVADALRSIGCATLRVELYGHGQSEGAFRDHTLFKWLSNALAVVDYAKSLEFMDGLYIAGHSQGGLLAALTGAMEQDSVDALILLSPALMIPETARGNFAPGDRIPENLYLTGSSAVCGNYARAARLLYVQPLLQSFRKPVLLVHGSLDEAVPLHYSEDAARQYENAALVIIPDDDHCYDAHLDEVEAAVIDFMLSRAKGR